MGMFSRIPKVMQGPIITLIKTTGGIDIEDPDLLHEQLANVIVLLSKGLELDHENGYGPEGCKCTGPHTTKGLESISSGEHEEREVDSSRDNDGGVSERVLEGTVSGEDSDSRYQAEV